MTQAEMANLLAVMSELWPNWPMPADERLLEVRIQAWREVLTDVGFREALDAVQSLAREARPFAPSTGEVYQEIVRRRLYHHDAEIPDPAEGWAELKGAVRSVGAMGSPTFSHPVIQSAVEALGFPDFCMSATDDEPSWRAQYLRFHETYARRYAREHHSLEELGPRHTPELDQ